jgi:putative PIN family toxin of toxin-antitoxin system
MIRVVLDTNTLVSAVGWKHSKPRIILEACLSGKYLLVESPALLKEFVAVVERPKFGFIPEEQKKELVARLINYCEIVEPKKKLNIIKSDPADNKVLECALEGKAQYIISGDNHLLRLKDFRGISIVTATDYHSLTLSIDQPL